MYWLLSAHNLWGHLAHPRTLTYWKHGGFALILSSVSWQIAVNGSPKSMGMTPFFSHCDEVIRSFALEKTNLISIAKKIEQK